MGPCASTFLSSDHVSDFQFLVGVLSLRVPVALTVSKRELGQQSNGTLEQVWLVNGGRGQ